VSTAPTDPSLTVRFPLLPERNTSRVTSYTLKAAYTTSTDGFEFELYDTDHSKLFGLEMQPVELLINGKSQLIGRIDSTEIGGNGSAVTCRGRDYLADLVECNVDPTAIVTASMDLGQAILLVAAPVGIQTVFADDGQLIRNVRSGAFPARRKPSKKRHKQKVTDYAPKPGEGIFEYLNRLVARQGATLQPAGDRKSLVVDEPCFDQDSLYQLSRSDDPGTSVGNNIIEATASRDWSSFPTYTLFSNKAGDAGTDKSGISSTKDIFQVAAGSQELLDIIGRSTLSGRWKPTDKSPITDGQLYRLLYHRDADSRSQEQIDNAVARAIAERFKETLRYSVTLRGHADPKTGAIWAIDTLVDVADAICGVNETLWIHSREFSYSPQQGATTKLECWRPHSFTIGSDNG
jgi:prophage tail gpP-like protein